MKIGTPPPFTLSLPLWRQHTHDCCTVDNAFDMFAFFSDLEPVNPARRAEQREKGREGGSFSSDQHSPLFLCVSPPNWLTIWLSAQDLLLSGANKVRPVVFSEPERSGGGKQQDRLGPEEEEDVMEEGRGWYRGRSGQRGEEGESWGSCLFNIFILISALGTQRRIHPENWIISLRWVKHT